MQKQILMRRWRNTDGSTWFFGGPRGVPRARGLEFCGHGLSRVFDIDGLTEFYFVAASEKPKHRQFHILHRGKVFPERPSWWSTKTLPADLEQIFSVQIDRWLTRHFGAGPVYVWVEAYE